MDWSFANIDWDVTLLANYIAGIAGMVVGLLICIGPIRESDRKPGARLFLMSLALGAVGAAAWLVAFVWPMAFPKPDRFPIPKATAKEVDR